MLHDIKNKTLNAAQTAIDNFRKVPFAPLQKGLLVLTTGCAILSAIPPYRLAGSLALRTFALLSAGSNFAGGWQAENQVGQVAQIAKISFVALGLVAVLAASPILMIASVTADLGLQVFELGRAVFERNNERALCHLGAVAIDIFAVGAILTSSSGMMMTAALVSTAVMAAFAANAFIESGNDSSNILDGFCYVALAGVGFASIFSILPQVRKYNLVPEKYYFKVHNRSSEQETYYDYKGRLLGTTKPGDNTAILIERDNCLEKRFWGEVPKPIKAISINADGTRCQYYILPKQCGWKQEEIQAFKPPLAAAEFPKLPIGGTAIVTKDLR